MGDYQTLKKFLMSLSEMTIEELQQVSDFQKELLKDENKDDQFVYYNNVSDLQRNFVFDFQKLQNETGILYIDYINLSIQKYSERFEKDNVLFKMVNYGNRMLSESLINTALDKNENVRDLTSDYVLKGVQAIEESTDVMDNAKDEFEKNKKEILSYLNLLLENEKINVFRSLKSETQQTSEIPEPELYEKETGRKNIPYKLALLRELGILDRLNIQFSDNKEQLYRILDYLTGGNTKGYYLSMYGENYKGKDRVTQAHNADLRQKGLI